MSLIKEAQTSNTRKYIATIAKLAIACVSMASVSFATTLTGFGSAFLQAGNGSVVVSGNGATGGCIIWYNAGNPPNTCPTTGNGNLTVQGGSSAPFFVGDPGTITNLSNPGGSGTQIIRDLQAGTGGLDSTFGINAAPYNANTTKLELGFWAYNAGSYRHDFNVTLTCTSGTGSTGPSNPNGSCTTGGGNVPLPGTLALFGIAALGLGIRRIKLG